MTSSTIPMTDISMVVDMGIMAAALPPQETTMILHNDRCIQSTMLHNSNCSIIQTMTSMILLQKRSYATKKMQKIRDETALSGVPVEIEDLVTEGKGRQDIEFYEEALGVPVLKGPSYWTEVKGYKAFPDMAPRVGGFGVSHETGLSERQELNQGPDSVDVDLDDSDPTDFFVAEDGEEEEETEEEVSNEPVDRERVWNGCFTMFEGLCNDIRTKEQYDRLHRVLTEQRLQVAEENAPAVSTHNPAGMATLPSVETNRTEKRKTKFGSPEAKGEKKRRK